jgi:hypothetical protein
MRDRTRRCRREIPISLQQKLAQELAQGSKPKKNADPGITLNRRFKMKKADETVGVSSAFNSV